LLLCGRGGLLLLEGQASRRRRQIAARGGDVELLLAEPTEGVLLLDLRLRGLARAVAQQLQALDELADAGQRPDNAVEDVAEPAHMAGEIVGVLCDAR